MSTFIKLSKRVINTRTIQYIAMENDKIVIEFSHTGVSGFFMLGVGIIDSTNSYAEFCKYKDTEDYNKIMKWIDKFE